MAPCIATDIPTDGISAHLESREPDPLESKEGRKHIAMVVTEVNWMEWLWLNHATLFKKG